ncbi:transcriptional regulator [Yersinia enterocolitica]
MKMTKCYVINDIAIFHPWEQTIMSLASGNRIKLNAPTSQLLEAFIKNMGNTISQNDLYTIVWGENSISVTPNTLYQNVSLLRKALKDSGIAGESLTTIRGKGFLFTVSTVFEKVLDDSSNTEVAVSRININYKALFSFATVIVFIFSGVTVYNVVANYIKDYSSLVSANECSNYDFKNNKVLDNI